MCQRPVRFSYCSLYSCEYNCAYNFLDQGVNKIMCACILNVIVKKFTGCACTVLVLGFYIVVYLQYSYYMYNII